MILELKWSLWRKLLGAGNGVSYYLYVIVKQKKS